MSSDRLTTRSLLAMVVLGAATAPFIRLAVILNATLAGTAGWLAYPAPTPFFLGSVIAFLLIRKAGVATLTGLITAVIGFGAMALLCALFIELVIFLSKPLWSITSQQFFTLKTFLFSAVAGATGGVGIAVGIFMVEAARNALPMHLLFTGALVKTIIGVGYGLLAWIIAKALFSAGVNPQGLYFRSQPAPAPATPAGV